MKIDFNSVILKRKKIYIYIYIYQVRYTLINFKNKIL